MKKFLNGLLAAGMLFGSLSASNALTFFAQVNQIGSGTPYVWNNNEAGTNGAFTVNPNPLNVTFQFQVPVPVIGTNSVAAKLVISAVNSGTMVGAQQPIEQLSFKIVATNLADYASPGNNVLLETIMPVPLPGGIGGEITGTGSTAFLGTDFLRGLVMRSDYLSIDPNNDQSATWSFSKVLPSPVAPDLNGVLRDTLFSGNGNFSANIQTTVPEPGAVAMLASFSVGGGMLLIRRRRNR